MNWGALAAAGVDLEATLSARRWGRRAARQSRREAAPALDVDAWLRDWTTPPRNRPPGLDGAAAFLHAFQDGVEAGASAARHYSHQPPEDALEAITRDCSCHEPVKKGAACGQGGVVAEETPYEYHATGVCRATFECLDQQCAAVSENSADAHGYCDYACVEDTESGGKTSYGGTVTGPPDCNRGEPGKCDCTFTCDCDNGTTGTYTAEGLSATGSEDGVTHLDEDVCPPGWASGYGPGGNGPGGGGGGGGGGSGSTGGYYTGGDDFGAPDTPPGAAASAPGCVGCGSGDYAFTSFLGWCERQGATVTTSCSLAGETCTCSVACHRALPGDDGVSIETASATFSFYCGGATKDPDPAGDCDSACDYYRSFCERNGGRSFGCVQVGRNTVETYCHAQGAVRRRVRTCTPSVRV